MAQKPVHPRLRGEHPLRGAWSPPSPGSSPPTRGTLAAKVLGWTQSRFIPAYAGNTDRWRAILPVQAVHPRLRGEHGSIVQASYQWSGSSPPTRGTRLRLQCGDQRGRFIPAYAGNTSTSRWPRSTSAVHPRLRGEHTLLLMPAPVQSGSSPPTRGTRITGVAGGARARFIPAYAGNTDRPG